MSQDEYVEFRLVRVRSRYVFFDNLRFEKKPSVLGFQRCKQLYLDLKYSQFVSIMKNINNCKLHSKKLANSTLYGST